MLSTNQIVPAKLVSLSLKTQPFVEVLPKDSTETKNVFGVSSSGQKIQKIKRTRMMMTLVGPEGQHFAIDVYKQVRFFYPGTHFTETFLDNLRKQLQDFTFQVYDDQILNLKEILKSI